MADKLFGKETVAGAEKVRNTAAEIQNIFSKIDMTQLSKSMQIMAQSSKDMAGDLSNSLKYSKENKKTAQQQSKAAVLQAKYATSQNKIAKTFRSFQVSMLKGQDDFTTGLKESSQEYNNLKQGAKDLVSEMGEGLEAISAIDDAFGGVGAAIGGFVTSPLTIAVGLLMSFNSQQEAIANQFGAMGVTRFGSELQAVNDSAVDLGFSLEEGQKSVSDLANQFGLSIPDAAKLSEAAMETAKGLGMSVEESGKLLGTLTTVGGLTTQQATDLAKQTQSLAEANNVAPDKVLNDIAGNTELFAKYAKDGGANVARAAIQARKLGVEIGDIASSMEGMLDFQGSLNAEIEASVLLGRNLNLQKARELSLADDIEGFQKEILKQVGSEAEFNKMNVLQKQALAKATNLSVTALSKMVSKEKEATTLAGEMAKQDIGDLISDESITKTAQLMNTLKAFGMELSAKLGPAIEGIVGGVLSFVKALDSTIGIMPALIGFMGIMAVRSAAITFNTLAQTAATLGLTSAKTTEAGADAVGTAAKTANTAATLANTTAKGVETAATSGGTLALIASTTATVANTIVKGASAIASYAAAAGAMVLAAANFMAGAAAGSLASVGFGAPVLIAFAVAGIAAMIAGIAAARNAGDMVSPAKGQTQISTKEGGLFNMSKNDDILAGPGLATAMGGTGGETSINIDTSAIERGNAELKIEVAQLRKDMSSYFGFGGSAIKGIGGTVAAGVAGLVED